MYPRQTTEIKYVLPLKIALSDRFGAFVRPPVRTRVSVEHRGVTQKS